MKRCWKIAVAVFAVVLWLPTAHAAITCTTVTSPGVSLNYVNNTTASVQTYFEVSCTRGSTSDPTSVTYDVTADNGLNPIGVNNRARHSSGELLRYDLFTGASCGTQWKGNTAISDTITWASGSTGTLSRRNSFWGCITTAQTASSSGLYSDSLGLTLKYGTSTITGTAPVTLYAPALCTFTTAAGDINIPYAAFGAQVTRSTTFAVRCTTGMPYTMATDVTEAVLTGVRYTLDLSAMTANGTGGSQSHTITATVPAGQAGACTGASCVGTRAHTLTISY